MNLGRAFIGIEIVSIRAPVRGRSLMIQTHQRRLMFQSAPP